MSSKNPFVNPINIINQLSEQTGAPRVKIQLVHQRGGILPVVLFSGGSTREGLSAVLIHFPIQVEPYKPE
jgi:hypothetical protein